MIEWFASHKMLTVFIVLVLLVVIGFLVYWFFFKDEMEDTKPTQSKDVPVTPISPLPATN